jgi:hypothetical protein
MALPIIHLAALDAPFFHLYGLSPDDVLENLVLLPNDTLPHDPSHGDV